MPLTDVPSTPGTDASTRVTSAYALLPRNATSVAPPGPKIRFGRQSANVDVSPLPGSIRTIRPAIPSVTYRAPSGPTVLPNEPWRPDTRPSGSVLSGCPGGDAAAAAGAASTRAVAHSRVIHRRARIVPLPSLRGPEETGAGRPPARCGRAGLAYSRDPGTGKSRPAVSLCGSCVARPPAAGRPRGVTGR